MEASSMKLQTSNNPIYLSVIAITCAAIATTAQISANIASDRAQSTRSKALKVTAQHDIADTCWVLQGTEPLKIGDRIDIGSTSSRTPTACFKGNGQYGFAAYINGQLQITHVFSNKEIQASKSALKEQK
jgi:hypothetical protein